jgi:hypothetical protein
MFVLACILLSVLFGAINCAGNEKRWREVKAIGIPADKHPLLALIFPVVQPPNHKSNMLSFVVCGAFWGIVLSLFVR